MHPALEKEARAVHARVVKEYGLTNGQAAAVPSLRAMFKKLDELALEVQKIVLMTVIPTPDSKRKKREPARPLTPEEEKQFELLRDLISLTTPVRKSTYKDIDIAAEHAQALDYYERYCRKIIDLQTKPRRKPNSPLENFLVQFFPMPPATKPSPSRPARARPSPRKTLKPQR